MSLKIRYEVTGHASFGGMDNIARKYASPSFGTGSQANVSLGDVGNVGGKTASIRIRYVVTADRTFGGINDTESESASPLLKVR